MDIKNTDIGSVVRDVLSVLTDTPVCDIHEDGCENHPWSDHGYTFEENHFELHQSRSCDGFVLNLIDFEGQLVYKDTSYDDSEPRIEYHLPGKWEQLLREYLQRLIQKNKRRLKLANEITLL